MLRWVSLFGILAFAALITVALTVRKTDLEHRHGMIDAGMSIRQMTKIMQTDAKSMFADGNLITGPGDDSTWIWRERRLFRDVELIVVCRNDRVMRTLTRTNGGISAGSIAGN